MRWLFAPAALAFGAVVKGRHALYERKWLSVQEAPLPVVSIGNLAMGGAGKTPFTLKLAEELLAAHRVAIVSRGYRGEAEKRREPLIVSRGGGPVASPDVCGDEPYLLARRLPEAIVVAGRDRVRGARVAKELGAEVVLLDDGMQHRRLARDVEIVLLTGEEEGHFFPWGRLRDDPKRLASADFCFEVEHAGVEVVMASGEEQERLDGLPVAVFCAVARPRRFVETVAKMGGEPLATLFARDHKPFSLGPLTRFAARAKERGAKLLLCTEKDAVKLLPEAVGGLPVGWVRSRAEVKGCKTQWETLINTINALIGTKR